MTQANTLLKTLKHNESYLDDSEFVEIENMALNIFGKKFKFIGADSVNFSSGTIYFSFNNQNISISNPVANEHLRQRVSKKLQTFFKSKIFKITRSYTGGFTVHRRTPTLSPFFDISLSIDSKRNQVQIVIYARTTITAHTFFPLVNGLEEFQQYIDDFLRATDILIKAFRLLDTESV